MSGQVLAVFSQIVTGAALLALGRWALRRADQLVPMSVGLKERRRRIRVARRGAITCQACGVLVLVMCAAAPLIYGR